MNLIDYLPSFFHHSGEVTNIQSSIQIERDVLQTAIEDLLDQLFVDTATWGLAYWEQYVGLTADRVETLDNRRSRVMTRLRGQGTTTKDMIENVCSAFSGGEVEVIEHSAEYRFVIKFIGTLGIPGNIEYLRSTIEEIKPAHLAFSFEYTYNTWAMVEAFGHAWDFYENLGLTWDQVSVMERT